jgi:hypothetical protein
MCDPMPIPFENSAEIASDNFQRTGGLDDPEIARKILINSVKTIQKRGHRKQMFSKNAAIECQKLGEAA